MHRGLIRPSSSRHNEWGRREESLGPAAPAGRLGRYAGATDVNSTKRELVAFQTENAAQRQ
jgi:hypothetical protein